MLLLTYLIVVWPNVCTYIIYMYNFNKETIICYNFTWHTYLVRRLQNIIWYNFIRHITFYLTGIEEMNNTSPFQN
jgi:hypothetical protein